MKHKRNKKGEKVFSWIEKIREKKGKGKTKAQQLVKIIFIYIQNNRKKIFAAMKVHEKREKKNNGMH